MLLGRATFARVMERTRPRIGLGRDFDRLWLGESVSARMLGGAALVVAAVALNAVAGGGAAPATEPAAVAAAE